MNKNQFEILKNGGVLKVEKNQIYFDDIYGFIAEIFEFVENGQDMFSVLDAFENFEDAVLALRNPEKYINSIIN